MSKKPSFFDKIKTAWNQGLSSLKNLSKNDAMKYGYARVSIDDQKADLRIAVLKKADCQHIFTDTATRTHPLSCIPSGRRYARRLETQPGTKLIL
ncbi:MAG: hypothetical protein ABSB19_02935 [Methylomonas sp.]|jgi:predicted site-specific integrase-resolvase